MNVIQPNCRVQFTADDINFIITALGRDLTDRPFLAQLLADEDSRDQILDDECLYRRLPRLPRGMRAARVASRALRGV